MEFTSSNILSILNKQDLEHIDANDCRDILVRLNRELNDDKKKWLAHTLIELARPGSKVGGISDGYHTYDELYEHRTTLFACLCAMLKNDSWYSMHHADPVKDPMYKDMFIAGISTPYGDCTYHCEMSTLSQFMGVVKELPNAPEFDGHTPSAALNRIYNYCVSLRNYTKKYDADMEEVGFTLIRSVARCAAVVKLSLSNKEWNNGAYHQFYMTMVINLMDLGYSVEDISCMLKKISQECGADWPFMPIE